MPSERSGDGVEQLDVRTTAALVGRSPETVRRWIWSGELPAHKRGNILLIARPDLDRWLARRAHPLGISLGRWAEQLEGWAATDGDAPQQTPGTAADLVLEDRRRRSTEVDPRSRR